MNQLINSLSSLTQLTSKNSLKTEERYNLVHDSQFNNIVSSAFSKISETSTQYKEVINALSNEPYFSSDSKTLLQLQNYIGEYTNYISLVSTLARKGVTTIETLGKSQ